MSAVKRVLVVLGHGRATSLCHHLTGVAREALGERGAEHRSHDLLADGFDPCLRLAPGERQALPPKPGDDPLVHRYCEDVRWADAYIVVHPVWWFAPPAILKGWVDRVLVDGVALHQPQAGPPVGTLSGRRALVVQTFPAPRAVDTLLMRNLAEAFWKRAVFGPVGIRHVKRVALYGVEDLTADQLAAQERRLRRAVAALLRSGG
jgi:putative NADPH-quinone reductase